MNRRTAIAKAATQTTKVALAAIAAPAALSASTENQAPKIASTMWWSAWQGDEKVFRELILARELDRDALDDLARQRPEVNKFQYIKIGDHVLAIEPHNAALQRLDTDAIWKRLTDALDGRDRARKSGDTEAEKHHDAIVRKMLHV
jgi:hypothetical protein